MVKKEFFTLLREHSEIDRHSRWYDVKKKLDSDPRYKAVDSSSQREDWFSEYCKILKDEKRRAKEKDRDSSRKDKKDKRDKDDGDKDRHKEKKDKDKEKDKDKKDQVERETSVEDGEQKDIEENEEKHSDREMEDDDREQKEKEKQARTEASLRAREKEVQRTLATHLRDRDKEREQHKHDEAVQHLNALFADLVRNSDLSWRDAKRQLRKDSRWDLAELLSRDEKEKLFNAHIDQLIKKKRDKFREMLNELSELTLTSQWKDIKKLIRDDSRYSKFSTSSDKCEREFKDYLKDKMLEAKAEFQELLQESKLLTHESITKLRENETQYMNEMEEILKNDKRFLVLDCIRSERSQLIVAYLEDLEKRGPPPPPTACEPNRRSNK